MIVAVYRMMWLSFDEISVYVRVMLVHLAFLHDFTSLKLSIQSSSLFRYLYSVMQERLLIIYYRCTRDL
jgi:hypothetical protein